MMGLPASTLARLDAPLADLLAQAQAIETAGETVTRAGLRVRSERLAGEIEGGIIRFDAQTRVQVDARIIGEGPTTTELRRFDVQVERHRPDLGRAQYLVPSAALGSFAELPGIRWLQAPSYAMSQTGSLLTEGDVALGSAAVRAGLGVDGSGIRVGIISDGIAGLAEAQASGDAPELDTQRAFSSDGLEAGAEGTAMIEIVHDVAPGAILSFANASTDLDMIEAVNFLSEFNDIVIDDLAFFFPDDQQSAVARNTSAALNNPSWPIRSYVTSVGNWALRHYQAAFVAGPDGQDEFDLEFTGAVHEFHAEPGTVDVQGLGPRPSNEIYMETGDEALGILFWDDPWNNATNDYDLFLIDATGAIVDESSLGQGTGFDQPRERFFFKNNGPAGRFQVVVQNFEDAAAGVTLDLFVFGTPKLPGQDLALNFNTAASSLLAQADAGGGVLSIAAVSPTALSTVRNYSSRGPTNNGMNKPDLTALDGVSVTGSGGFDTTFFGTSAAAPHVAAIAALLLEAVPALTAVDGGNADHERALLRGLLTGTAVDLGAPGIDTETGAGRIDALAAVERAVATIVTVDSDADAGPGTFRAAISDLNAAAAVALGADPTARPHGGAILFQAPMTITLEAELPAITAPDVAILGVGSVVEGGPLSSGGIPNADTAGLVIAADGVVVDNLGFFNFAGTGVWIRGADDVVVTQTLVVGNGVGVRIDQGATGVSLGTLVRTGVIATGNTAEGILIAGAETRAVRVHSSFIGVDPDGAPAGNAAAGVRISGGASANIVGAALEGAGPTTAQEIELAHTFVGTVTINGLPAPEGTVIEAIVDDEAVVATTLGTIDVESLPGFVFTLTGPGVAVSFRVDGIDDAQSFDFVAGEVSRVTLNVQRVASVGASPLLGSNRIAFNAGGGIRVEGDLSLGNTFRGNALHSNQGLEIDLVGADDPASGLTPNDANDADSGPNELLNRPRITSVAFLDARTTIRGTSEPGTVVDIYAAMSPEAAGVAANPAGAGGAVRFLGSTRAEDGTFTLEGVELRNASMLTALATDEQGNTSEFGANVEIGVGPSIDGLSPSRGSRQGGTIVTVSGTGFRDAAATTVFIGGREAQVISTNPFELVLRTPAAPEGRVPIVVINPDGRSTVQVNAFTYAAIRSVPLRAGWNNVTWEGTATTITAALGGLAGRVDRIFAWDGRLQRYDGFIVAAPAFINTLTALGPGQVVWLFINGTEGVLWEQALPN